MSKVSMLIVFFFFAISTIVFVFVRTSIAEVRSVELNIPSDVGPPAGLCNIGATLLLPYNPKALVVIVHGNGRRNRDGSGILKGMAIYKDIAEHLASKGFASLRYDKRQNIKECDTKTRHPDYKMSQLILDIENISNYALKLPELKNTPLILLAHSQGVNLIVESAVYGNLQPKGLILMAGLGHYPIDKTLLRQFRELLSLPNIPEEKRKAIEDLVSEGEKFFKRIRSGNFEKNEKYYHTYAGIWAEWIKYTDRARESALKLKAPTLVIQGEKDFNVTKLDFKALKNATSKVCGSKAILYPGIHHVLAKLGASSVDSEILKDISTWLSEILSYCNK